MATKKKPSKSNQDRIPTKTSVIRKLLLDRPELGANDVVKEVAKKKITTTAQSIFSTAYQLRKKWQVQSLDELPRQGDEIDTKAMLERAVTLLGTKDVQKVKNFFAQDGLPFSEEDLAAVNEPVYLGGPRERLEDHRKASVGTKKSPPLRRSKSFTPGQDKLVQELLAVERSLDALISRAENINSEVGESIRMARRHTASSILKMLD